MRVGRDQLSVKHHHLLFPKLYHNGNCRWHPKRATLIITAMSWQAVYQSRLTSPEEAAGIVKSGDLVYVPAPPHPRVVIQALADRRDELQDVKVCIDSHVFDPGWLQPGWGDSFHIVTEQFLGLGIEAYNDRL